MTQIQYSGIKFPEKKTKWLKFFFKMQNCLALGHQTAAAKAPCHALRLVRAGLNPSVPLTPDQNTVIAPCHAMWLAGQEPTGSLPDILAPGDHTTKTTAATTPCHVAGRDKTQT